MARGNRDRRCFVRVRLANGRRFAGAAAGRTDVHRDRAAERSRDRGERDRRQTSLRDVFASYLTGPSLQVVPLQARLASQAMEEATHRNCGHVLTVTLSRKHGGGALGRVVGHVAGTASWYVPGGGTVGSAVVRGVAIGTAQAVSALAASTKAKDEMQMEYRVSSPTGTIELGPTRVKRKAKVDGEDLLTPLVEKAAETIVGTLVKK
jgi:hypothetical protein